MPPPRCARPTTRSWARASGPTRPAPCEASTARARLVVVGLLQEAGLFQRRAELTAAIDHVDRRRRREHEAAHRAPPARARRRLPAGFVEPRHQELDAQRAAVELPLADRVRERLGQLGHILVAKRWLARFFLRHRVPPCGSMNEVSNEAMAVSTASLDSGVSGHDWPLPFLAGGASPSPHLCLYIEKLCNFCLIHAYVVIPTITIL